MLTSKNQTTIPKAVVAALHARPSATLCFEVEADGRVTLTAKAATFAQLVNSFPKKGRPKPATLGDMTAAIRAGALRASKSKRAKASQR